MSHADRIWTRTPDFAALHGGLMTANAGRVNVPQSLPGCIAVVVLVPCARCGCDADCVQHHWSSVLIHHPVACGCWQVSSGLYCQADRGQCPHCRLPP